MRTDKISTNHLLAARVCAELDHRVEHGKAIQVFADDYKITLRGIVLRDELDDVIAAVKRVKGIRSLINKLELKDSPGKVLALQS
jgi:osmotically-inducible protein OsmY